MERIRGLWVAGKRQTRWKHVGYSYRDMVSIDRLLAESFKDAPPSIDECCTPQRSLNGAQYRMA